MKTIFNIILAIIIILLVIHTDQIKTENEILSKENIKLRTITPEEIVQIISSNISTNMSFPLIKVQEIYRYSDPSCIGAGIFQVKCLDKQAEFYLNEHTIAYIIAPMKLSDRNIVTYNGKKWQIEINESTFKDIYEYY